MPKQTLVVVSEWGRARLTKGSYFNAPDFGHEREACDNDRQKVWERLESATRGCSSAAAA